MSNYNTIRASVLKSKMKKCERTSFFRISSIPPFTTNNALVHMHQVELIFSCALSSAASMTDNGTLKVDEFLQVKGQDNVFAIGDVTDINEQKLAYTARLHAEILATNLVAEAIKSPKTPYTPGKSSSNLFFA